MTLGFEKRRGGEAVGYGFYWNVGEWQAQIVPAAGATLEGTDETKYMRLPLLAVLVVAPLMGLVYAMFLPFIGFAMFAMFLMGRLKKTETRTPPAEEAAAEVTGKREDRRDEVEYKRAA